MRGQAPPWARSGMVHAHEPALQENMPEDIVQTLLHAIYRGFNALIHMQLVKRSDKGSTQLANRSQGPAGMGLKLAQKMQ